MGRPRKNFSKAVEIKSSEVLESVKNITLEGISKKIAGVQVDVQQTLAKLSTELTQNLEQLNTVTAAIELKKQELQQLHDIEVTKTSFDDLKTEIDNQRVLWAEEQLRREKDTAIGNQDRQLRWKREEEQYLYERAQSHKKLEDDFAAKVAEMEKANREQQEKLAKNWTARETALQDREAELVVLRKQVDEFPAKLKSEAEKSAAIVGNTMKKDHETEKRIMAAEAATSMKLAEAALASEKKANESLTKQIGELSLQLDQAKKDIKDISSKALESASGRDVIANLQRALENNQQRSSK
jgi:colicin import membrane protein